MSEAVLCPACPEAAVLTPGRSERADATLHCCNECCGIWVERETVDILALKARADLLPLWIGPPLVAVDRPAHRACPSCGTPMDRKACGEIVVDICGPHGVWFDCQELDHFMSWLRDRAEAHLRAVGAPMAMYSTLDPLPEGGGCGWIDSGDLPIVELVAAIFEIL
jgi:Zn-finger nucleic acid-binding protein